VNFDAVIRHQIGLQRRIVICGPKDIARQVQAKILSYTWNLIAQGAIVYEIREIVSEEEIEIFELEPPLWDLKYIGKRTGNQVYEEKAFSVNLCILDHKIPSTAYKFKEEDTIKIDIEASGFKGGKWVKELKEAFEQKQTDRIVQIE